MASLMWFGPGLQRPRGREHAREPVHLRGEQRAGVAGAGRGAVVRGVQRAVLAGGRAVGVVAVDVVDRDRRGGAGDQRDVLPVEEEGEDVVVLGVHPFVVLLRREHVLEREHAGRRALEVELEDARVLRQTADERVQVGVAAPPVVGARRVAQVLRPECRAHVARAEDDPLREADDPGTSGEGPGGDRRAVELDVRDGHSGPDQRLDDAGWSHPARREIVGDEARDQAVLRHPVRLARRELQSLLGGAGQRQREDACEELRERTENRRRPLDHGHRRTPRGRRLAGPRPRSAVSCAHAWRAGCRARSMRCAPSESRSRALRRSHIEATPLRVRAVDGHSGQQTAHPSVAEATWTRVVSARGAVLSPVRAARRGDGRAAHRAALCAPPPQRAQARWMQEVQRPCQECNDPSVPDPGSTRPALGAERVRDALSPRREHAP